MPMVALLKCLMTWVYSLMHDVDINVMTRIVAHMHAMC